MTRICYYISGHGFGHATRASQIAAALLRDPHTDLTLCTTAPRHLFPDHANLHFRRREVDSAIIQPLPYEIDVDATFDDLRRFLGDDEGDAWVTQELSFVASEGFDLILVDAPWIVGKLLDRITPRVPGVIISNFTFDLIFGTLLDHLPTSCPAAKRERYVAYARLLVDAYKSFDYLITLPGAIDFPFLEEPGCTTTVLSSPLIYRTPKRSKNEVLQILQIPEPLRKHKILLVQFGGHLLSPNSPHSSTSSDALNPPTITTTTTTKGPKVPDGWICLSATPSRDPRFFTFPPDFYLPDLIDASDLILGKIGYGTVSESVGMSKPVLYVSRPMFAEEPYLISTMAEHGVVALELNRDVFEDGDWVVGIEEVMGMAEVKAGGCGRRGERVERVEDGSGALAGMIHSLAAKRRRPDR